MKLLAPIEGSPAVEERGLKGFIHLLDLFEAQKIPQGATSLFARSGALAKTKTISEEFATQSLATVDGRRLAGCARKGPRSFIYWSFSALNV